MLNCWGMGEARGALSRWVHLQHAIENGACAALQKVQNIYAIAMRSAFAQPSGWAFDKMSVNVVMPMSTGLVASSSDASPSMCVCPPAVENYRGASLRTVRQ
jgi:hypothetical protein